MVAAAPTNRGFAPPASPAPEPLGESHHLVLVGFMGAGKTSVGKLLAERTGMRFVDLDELIAEKAQKSIRELFKEGGEVAFRARERAALREVLADKTPQVIATGGGTFVDPLMRKWIQDASRTIYLEASPEVLLSRVTAGEERNRRPLLSGPDPEQTVERLLSERQPAYEQCDYRVRADQGRVEQIVTEIVRLLRLEKAAPPPRRGAPARSSEPRVASSREPGTVIVRARQGDYRVHVREEAGTWIATEIAAVCPGQRLAIITDEVVAQFHLRALLEDLRHTGKVVTSHAVPPGEESKSLAIATALYDALLADGLDRGDAVVALGGGMVGDLAGFVAATYLRGIRVVQVPTSTLAAVDASVGGKTAVNTPRGKNLVGAFHAPRAVLIAAEHLATQGKRAHAAGLVEAVKMAATMDAELFATLAREARDLVAFAPGPLVAALRRAVAIKADVVSRDETETGERVVLNYGHTIGHAIEKGEGYRLLHGEAVALGMVAEAQWAESEGFSSQVSEQLVAALGAFGVPTDWRSATIDPEALRVDKKREGDRVRLVVVESLGNVQTRTVSMQVFADFARLGRSK